MIKQAENQTLSTYENTKNLSNLLYVVFIITSCYSIFVSSQILVSNDPSATVENIYAKEYLFRAGLVFSIIISLVVIFLLLIFFRLFRRIKELRPQIMILLIISQIPVSFFISGLINTFMIVKNNLLTNDGPERVNEFAAQILSVSAYTNMIEDVEWGMWLIPFAMLVYASDFIPRIYGRILLAGGFMWIIYCISFSFFPQYHDLVTMVALPCGIIAEISFTLWFLTKGMNEPELKILNG